MLMDTVLSWSHASWVVADAQQEARVHRSRESDECAKCVIFICLPDVFRDRGSKTTSWTDDKIIWGEI